MTLAFLEYTPIVDIEIGPLSISPHGLGIAVGFLLGGLRIMLPRAQARGITDEQVYALLVRGIFGAFIGMRVAYVVNHLGSFDSPVEWFQVWEGGLSLLGGIAGGVLLAAPKARAEGLSFWKVMDAAAPGLAFGIIIGRIGDLVVADHLGKPTDFFLGYVCPDAETASPCIAPVGEAVHQPALYDLMSLLVLFPLLLWLERKRRYDGFLILVFGFVYGMARFVEDFGRIDETHGTGLTGSQWTGVATALVCLFALTVLRRTPWRSGQGPLASEPDGSPDPWPEDLVTDTGLDDDAETATGSAVVAAEAPADGGIHDREEGEGRP